MNTKTTGGPAFPQAFAMSPKPAQGMTLRDYFASKAMLMRFGSAGSSMAKEQMAAECYAMADAMLKAREES